ncbi:hypothetical protein C8J57DRAFT_1253839 [Mycena rebaudengoi]|nr:hypothetical protein C8J57DRAFT_1253839 [Mycena rebaudengoi]
MAYSVRTVLLIATLLYALLVTFSHVVAGFRRLAGSKARAKDVRIQRPNASSVGPSRACSWQYCVRSAMDTAQDAACAAHRDAAAVHLRPLALLVAFSGVVTSSTMLTSASAT